MAHVDRSQSWPRRTPSGSCATQAPRERRLNVCRQEFNHERPHEALDEDTRAASYTPSPRPLPDRLPPLEYPDRFEVRYVSANGCIRWKGRWAPSARMSRLPHRGRSVTALEVHLLCLHHVSLTPVGDRPADVGRAQQKKLYGRGRG